MPAAATSLLLSIALAWLAPQSAGEEPVGSARAEATRALAAARERREAGDARSAAEQARGGLEALLAAAETPPDRAWAELLVDLAAVARASGELSLALAGLEAVVAWGEIALDPDDRLLLRARGNTAVLYSDLGRPAEAAALEERLREAFDRTLPAGHPTRVIVRLNLARSVGDLGDPARAVALLEEARALLEEAESSDAGLREAVWTNLAVALQEQGDLAGAEPLLRRVAASREERLAPGDPDLLRALGNLSALLRSRGALAESRALLERAVRGYEAAYPADHPDVLWIRSQLAGAAELAGDLAAALRLREDLLARQERRLPAGHEDLTRLRAELASTLRHLGRRDEARALAERAASELAHLPPGDGRRLLAELELARAMREQDDLVGALNLAEEIDAAATLAGDRDASQRARIVTALCLRSTGDVAAARAHLESVVGEWSERLPGNHPDLLELRGELAGCLFAEGRHAEAAEAYRRLLDDGQSSLPPDHRTLLAARANLAGALSELEPERALELLRESLATYRAARPLGDPNRVASVHNLALTLAQLGRLDEARALARPLCDELMAALEATGAAAPREAWFAAARLSGQVSLALALLDEDDPTGFELLETQRAAAAAVAVRAEAASSSELAAELARVRRALAEEVGLAPEAQAPDARDSGVARLARERDRLERALRAAERDELPLAVRLEDVSGALGEDEAAVAYRLVDVQFQDVVDGRWRVEPRFLAHVVAPGGVLARLDLGSAEELRAAALAWRDAVGTPVASRGLSAGSAAGGDELARLGSRLRERLLQPALERAPRARRWTVVPHDALALLPFGALLGEPEAVEVVHARSLVEIARRGASPPPAPAEERLVLLGDPPFGAGSDLRFPPLPATRTEVERIAALFAGDPERVQVLVGERATREALLDLASGARWLHLATHGWFDLSSLAARDTTVREAPWVAPLALCGLALAGAGAPRDDLGRLPGVLTAEELAGLDLSGCELAVLSACDTSAGVRSAGEGVVSLQAALRAAGARSVLAALWKVDDVATGRLMESLYRYLWQERLSIPEALRRAQVDLFREGAPPRDWAAWVLSGE